jgi:signal transduction histidine kinase
MEQEIAYAKFVLPANLILLRLVTGITLFGMTAFLIVNYFLDVDFGVVLGTRIVVLLIAALLMAYTFKKPLNPKIILIGNVIIGIITLGSALITATYAKMPAYYLTNLLFLILVLVIMASGMGFRYGLFLNIILFLIFIAYSQFIRRDTFYFSQYPHLIISFIYFHLVGIVIEHRRRSNFLQFNELVDQKVIVENLNQQKNKIISILSHDIASPLNSLSGLLYLQAEGHVREEELKPFLTDMVSQVNSVSSLLQSLVRWSRSQMEGFVPEKKLVDLNYSLKDQIAFFQPAATSKGVSLKLVSEENLMIVTDYEMTRIAIRNLVSNAIKFALVTTDVLIECHQDNDKITVRVLNEGPPIPDHLKSKLFSFDMPSTDGTKGEKGTGLGLAMAAFFVNLNGGTIFLESSEKEHQTCFCIVLPKAKEHSAQG